MLRVLIFCKMLRFNQIDMFHSFFSSEAERVFFFSHFFAVRDILSTHTGYAYSGDTKLFGALWGKGHQMAQAINGASNRKSLFQWPPLKLNFKGTLWNNIFWSEPSFYHFVTNRNRKTVKCSAKTRFTKNCYTNKVPLNYIYNRSLKYFFLIWWLFIYWFLIS